MNDKLEDLLNAFRDACESELKFLVSEHEARHETGFSTFEGRPPILKEDSLPQSCLFWFISRYAWADFVLDIGYGDRELVIEPAAYYLAIGKRFSPWEILTATAIPKTEGISGATWVGTVGFVQRSVEALSRSIKLHWHAISCPEPQVIDRALQQRGQRILFAQEEQRRSDRYSAVKQRRSLRVMSLALCIFRATGTSLGLCLCTSGKSSATSGLRERPNTLLFPRKVSPKRRKNP